MKPLNPYNIWVYHRKDNKTSFGEYIHAKRRVFMEGKLFDPHTVERLISYMKSFYAQTGRKMSFKGDYLPPAFLDLLPDELIA